MSDRQPNAFVIGDATHLVDPSGRPTGAWPRKTLCKWDATSQKSFRRISRAGAGYVKPGFNTRISARWRRSASPGQSSRSGRFAFSGFLAWLAWLVLHITVLIGFRNRISVLVSWIYRYAFSRRGSRLKTRSSESDPNTVTSGKSRSLPQSPASLRYVSAGRFAGSSLPQGSGPSGESG